MRPELIFACIAIIVVGVAVIMYTLFRSAKPAARIGSSSSIDLGNEVPDEAIEEESAEDAAQEEPTDEAADAEENA